MNYIKYMVVLVGIGSIILLTGSPVLAARGCETPDKIYWYDAVSYDQAPGTKVSISLKAYYKFLAGGSANMYFNVKARRTSKEYDFSGLDGGEALGIDFLDYPAQFWAITNFLQENVLPAVLGCDATGTDTTNLCPVACQPAPEAGILCTKQNEPYFSLKSVTSLSELDSAPFTITPLSSFMFMDFVIAIVD